MSAETQRLEQARTRTANWQRWGPYLSERQWGTVREDYSADGDCWNYFPHDHARSRAYRWGEDGLLGFTDRECRLCFGVALWNERDPILKERLFGLTGPEGNHGEDVKECYYYLDATPTYSYARALYKYPQAEYPYARLVAENRARGRDAREFELADAGVFAENRYFDVFSEYAKAGPDDLLIRLTIANRGPDPARLHVLPTLWFRNTWSWGCTHEGCEVKPRIERAAADRLLTRHATLESMEFLCGRGPNGAPPTLLFTENETNVARLYQQAADGRVFKDAFHDFVIAGRADAVSREPRGTKAAAHYVLAVPAQGEIVLRLRLRGATGSASGDAASAALQPRAFDAVFAERKQEADAFYAERLPAGLSAAERSVARQSYAGLLFTKQFFHYVVRDWLRGDPAQPTPPAERLAGRNREWTHVFHRDIVSMPDKWEYPWYAAWDLAFHMLPMARVDPQFAKDQLVLFLREWYMHPNGQIPAYEFALGDVNPPVHAWAVWRVYKLTGPRGGRDRAFLERCFHKLMLNFTWWVNRKDPQGNNLFAGGFLGMDNIGVFDRSRALPPGVILEQADGTAWMAFYCATMLSMALELARDNPAYEDVASKFFEHFVAIVDAMNRFGGTGLWHDEDGFYYDHLRQNGRSEPLRIRSMVGLVPLFAVEVLESEVIDQLPGFKKRTDWFLRNRPDLASQISYLEREKHGVNHAHYLLAIPSRERLERLLRYVLDERELLAPNGVRSLSRAHREHPFVLRTPTETLRVDYVPGDSNTGMFGGNSNWRGPIWFPMNYLLIEALERYHHFYGDDFTVEFPTGSGRRLTLQQVAQQLYRRMANLFVPDAAGARPCHGGEQRYADDPNWRDLVLFHEYFDGDTGRGVGASHQTGWTALLTRCLEALHGDADAHTVTRAAERPAPPEMSPVGSAAGPAEPSRARSATSTAAARRSHGAVAPPKA
ncbi:MAG: glucosidase [Phycisphaerae bacterium]